MSQDSKFRNKTAIVTGAASGIGRAVCEEMGRRGAVVVASDIDGEGADRVAAAVASAGGTATASRLDVTEADAVAALVEKTASAHGRLDYIFNNAGIGTGGEVYDVSLEQWRRIIDINLWGVIYGVSAAYPLMKKQGFGHIVNTASVAGLIALPMSTPYTTTKHAVVGLSSALREEAVAFGVKVSVVCPGFIRTAIFANADVANTDPGEARKGMEAAAEPLFMEVSDAATKILRGVERNQRIINFPRHARLWWLLHRLHPDLLRPLYRKMVGDYRSMGKSAT